MKKIIVLFALLMSLSTLAQSAKKQFPVLLAESERLLKVQDSISRSVLEKLSQLNHLDRELNNDILTASNQIYQFEYREKGLKEFAQRIQRLTTDVIIEYNFIEIKYQSMLDRIHNEKNLLDQERSEVHSKVNQLKMMEPLYLTDIKKVKQKNALLLKFNDSLKRNIANFNSLNRPLESYFENLSNSLEKNKSTFDSIINYETSQANLKYTELADKYAKLEANYLAKGPKGFSQAYANEWPNAFKSTDYIEPLLMQSYVDNDSYGVTEGSDNYNFSPPPPPPAQEAQIFDVIEELAEFPGGPSEMKKFIAENLKYPQAAKDLGISGSVYVKFLVSSKGTISNVKILRGIEDCNECSEEAKRLIKSMPQWIPGKNGGKEVNSWYKTRVKFDLK